MEAWGLLLKYQSNFILFSYFSNDYEVEKQPPALIQI